MDWFDIIAWITALAFSGYRLYDFARYLTVRDAKSRARQQNTDAP
jgi:hypothetical protein